MRFSIWPNLMNPWADVLAMSTHADATGWDGLYMADHFMVDAAMPFPIESPTLEATAGLAAVAAVTDRVRLGPLVFGGTYRHPAVLANWAATIDHVSDGRFVLGVGAGWQENEHEQYGIELPPVRERVDRFDEYVQVLNGLLRGSHTTFEGEWFQLTEAICEPKPLQRPLPVLVGATGNRMLGIVAREADEWNMWSMPEQFAERSAELSRRCEKAGRDPLAITRSTQALVMITDDEATAKLVLDMVGDRPAIAGSLDHFAEKVGEYRDVGVDEFIVPDFILGTDLAARCDNMDAIIERVAPQFR